MRSPRIFVSYSWTSVAHRSWVRDLAERLCFDGVEVVLDIWDLKEGQDKFAFMEQMVADKSLDRVLLVSDAKYASKADGREGGVGDETQIITAEVYRSAEQTKFIPIVTEYDAEGKACLPIYLRNCIYVDFSKAERFDESYGRLLRVVWQAPEHKKPPIGTQPAFVAPLEDGRSLRVFSRREDAVEEILRDIASARDSLSIYCRVYYSELVRRVQFERAIAKAARNRPSKAGPFRVRQVTTDPANMDAVRRLYRIEDPGRSRWSEPEIFRSHLSANSIDRFRSIYHRVKEILGGEDQILFVNAFYKDYLPPYSFVLIDDETLYVGFHTLNSSLRFGRDMPAVRIVPDGDPGAAWFTRFREEIGFIENYSVAREAVVRDSG
jgi:hypothetical protein